MLHLAQEDEQELKILQNAQGPPDHRGVPEARSGGYNLIASYTLDYCGNALPYSNTHRAKSAL